MIRQSLTKTVSVSELRQMRDDGLTNREIAKRLDVHPATIGRYLGPPDLKAHGKKKCSAGKEVTPDMAADMQRLYREGRSINSIAERFGVGWQTTKKIVAGSKMKPDTPPVSPAEPEPTAAAEPVCPVEPVPEPEPIAPAVQEPVAEEEQKGDNQMFEVLSKRQQIRLKGAECEYDLELGSGKDSVTVISGGTEVALFDAETLTAFISELQKIRDEYFGGAA